MARFSQAFLQGLLQPTYQQGLFEAARGLGQTPGIMRMQQQRKASQAEIQRLLQENEALKQIIAGRCEKLVNLAAAQTPRPGGEQKPA